MGKLPGLNRRVVTGGVATSVVTATGILAQTGRGASVATPNLKVAIALNGTTYGYPDGPKLPFYYVGFRGDGRIVFHLGALGDLTKPNVQPAPYEIGAHHVKIEKDGAVLFDADIPAHWWNAEWTYRPEPIAVKRTSAQIVATNLMFPYGDIGAKVGPPAANYIFKGPMDSSNITTYMPTTGERPDIGLITDASAYYMLSGEPGPMLAWAEAAGSCPIHFRVEDTGQPVDLIKYPRANSYPDPNPNLPYILAGPPKSDGSGYRRYGGNWTPQQAHYCEMSYLAYIATQDLGFLEDLQYSANFTILCDVWLSSSRGVATIYGELRGIAWALRNLFMAHAATKDAEMAGILPATCHPSSYWKTLLDNQLIYYQKFMTDPANQTFRLVSGGDRFGPWQADYTLMALAFGVLTGHTDWIPFYVWALGNVIARTNGTSGFPPGYGTPYYMNRVPWKTDATGKPMPGEFNMTATPFNWAQSADYCMTTDRDGSPLRPEQIAVLKADPLNGGKAMTGIESMMCTRAVLIAAAYLEKKGLANIRATYPELDRCVANADRMVRNSGSVNPRVSLIL